MTRTPIHRCGLLMLSLLLPLPLVRAEDSALRDLLRDALYTEEVTRDQDKAAKQYEDLLARHDDQKQFAASALFRLAEVRRKQNRKDDAIKLYQRLLTEFPNAEAETRLARENLATLGGKMPETKGAPDDDEAKELARLQAAATASPDVLLEPAALEKAAAKGWIKVVKFLLAAGSHRYDGQALQKAAQAGNLEIIKLLLADGGPVPEKVATDSIMWAITNKRTMALDFLLKGGLKPGRLDYGSGPFPTLAQAVMRSGYPVAEILLQNGVDIDEMVEVAPNNSFESCGSALHLAVSSGASGVVKWLLEKGAKADLPNLHFGITPLQYAARSEKPEALEMMKSLLGAGADPNRVSNDREAPDSLAKTILLNASPLETAIASHSMSLEKTKLLLEHKADPNRKNSRVSSMLALAISMEDPSASDLVQVLGEAGFRMTDRVLMGKAIGRNPKIVELLLKYGADPNTKLAEGTTMLTQACINGDVERVKLLLANGADPKQPGLLSQLIRRGPEAIPMIKILLEAGCDPNATDTSKLPPVVGLFDWNFENKNSGNVYLVSDKRSDRAKLLQLLLKYGLDPNTVYGEFSRSATKSRNPGYPGIPVPVGGNASPGPFIEEMEEPMTFPRSLMMMVVEMRNRWRVTNVDMIGSLLEAGAKPSVEFPEVFDFVAKGDESLPIAKALLPFRPKILNLDRSGYFMNWNPQVQRLFLDEILNPAIIEKGGVHFVFADRGGCRKVVEPNQAIPPMSELMIGNFDTLLGFYSEFAGKRYEPVITRVRRDASGQWLRESIDWRGEATLPNLAAGDIIELAKGKPVPDSENNDRAYVNLLAWNFRKRISFPVTVEIGGKTREIKLRGDLLSYDPTKNEAPLLSAGHLARLFLPVNTESGQSGLKQDSILTVRRKDGAAVGMDLSASGALEFKLQAGDYLILPGPESVMKPIDKQLRPVHLVIPGYSSSLLFQPLSNSVWSGKPTLQMPTLVQVLTDAYASGLASTGDQPLETRYPEFSSRVQSGIVPVILPHPDFSRIRIKRREADDKETIQEIDLNKAIQGCADDTPAADARKADVALFAGDVVELTLKADLLEQPWNGFTKEEERFFQKALGGVLMVKKPDGIIDQVRISYHQPDWKPSPHGMIPFLPKEGVPTTRLSALTSLTRMQGWGFLLKRDGVVLNSQEGDPFMRDGDEVSRDGVQNSAPPAPNNQTRPTRERIMPPLPRAVQPPPSR